MSDAPPREWRFYVADMIGFVEKVMAYTHGLDQAGLAPRQTQSFCGAYRLKFCLRQVHTGA